MTKRAAFYVDGFNLYHGIAGLHKPYLKWFSIWDYASFIAGSQHESLVKVQYFSALAYHRPGSVARHQYYLRALKSTGVSYTLGQFKNKPRECLTCGDRWTAHEEKETDVNIALQLLEDAMDNVADVIYLLSADSDLAPSVRMVQRRYPAIDFVSIAPPTRRHASELVQLSKRSLQIGEVALNRNRLPDAITDASGTFNCPHEYKLPI